MTIAEIKEQLPDVKVKLYGRIVTGQLAGRKLDYPTVHLRTCPPSSFQYSWETIQHSINTDTPLTI